MNNPLLLVTSLGDAIHVFAQQVPPQAAADMLGSNIHSMSDFFNALTQDAARGIRDEDMNCPRLSHQDHTILTGFRTILKIQDVAKFGMAQYFCINISPVFARVADMYDYSLEQAQIEQREYQAQLNDLPRREWELMQKPDGILKVYGRYQGKIQPEKDGVYYLTKAKEWQRLSAQERDIYNDRADKTKLGSSPRYKELEFLIAARSFEVTRSAIIAQGLTQLTPELSTISNLALVEKLVPASR